MSAFRSRHGERTTHRMNVQLTSNRPCAALFGVGGPLGSGLHRHRGSAVGLEVRVRRDRALFRLRLERAVRSWVRPSWTWTFAHG